MKNKVTLGDLYWKIRRTVIDSWWRFRRACQRFKRGDAWFDVNNFFDWFIDTIEPMLRHLAENHCSAPYKYTGEEWTQRLKDMADCLHYMDEQNIIDELLDGDGMRWRQEHSDFMKENCKKFFEMFSEDFYNIWN